LQFSLRATNPETFGYTLYLRETGYRPDASDPREGPVADPREDGNEPSGTVNDG